MSRLTVRDLSVVQGRLRILDRAAFEVSPGELVAVVGPNGAGKTTLMRAALGLIRRSGGESLLDGRPVDDLDPAARALMVGYLPQERRLAWGVPAVEVAALGAPLEAPSVARARAVQALARFGAEALAERSVFELSGGERARVLLARLFVTGAPLLVADEPVAGLDPDAQILCLDQLRAHADAGGSVLATLHDLGLAARYADRVLVIDGGAVVADAAPLKALTRKRMLETFGVRARWVDGPDGAPLLFMRRA